MSEAQPIDTAPRDGRVIRLSGGGYVCGTTGAEVLGAAAARYLHGYWLIQDAGVYAPLGYQAATHWQAIEGGAA